MARRQITGTAPVSRPSISQAPLTDARVKLVSFAEYAELGGALLEPQHAIVRDHVITPCERRTFSNLFKADLGAMAQDLPITSQDMEVITQMLVLFGQHERLQYGKMNASTPTWLLMEAHRLQGKDPDKLIDHMLGQTAL